jgi:hypothetical protein
MKARHLIRSSRRGRNAGGVAAERPQMEEAKAKKKRKTTKNSLAADWLALFPKEILKNDKRCPSTKTAGIAYKMHYVK